MDLNKSSNAVAIPTKKEAEFAPLSGSYQHSSFVGQSAMNRSLSSSHAEKRANHNAIERARRESLNIRFLELAGCIPALAHVRKPSKSAIVSRSIEYIQETKQRIEVKDRSLQLIRQQNEELKEEINRLRAEMGKAPIMFPDNIDLDLVYEAKLEHQKELELNSRPIEQHENRWPNQNGGMTVGSPFDPHYPLDNEEDEDNRSNFGSLLSPSVLDERFNQFGSPSAHMNHSILGNALQSNAIPVRTNQPHQSQYPMHPNSLPVGSPLVQSFPNYIPPNSMGHNSQLSTSASSFGLHQPQQYMQRNQPMNDQGYGRGMNDPSMLHYMQ